MRKRFLWYLRVSVVLWKAREEKDGSNSQQEDNNERTMSIMSAALQAHSQMLHLSKNQLIKSFTHKYTERDMEERTFTPFENGKNKPTSSNLYKNGVKYCKDNSIKNLDININLDSLDSLTISDSDNELELEF